MINAQDAGKAFWFWIMLGRMIYKLTMSEILGLYLCCLNSTIESRLNPVSLSPFYKSLFQGLGAVNAQLDLTLVLILISFEICFPVAQSCPTLYKPMDGSTPYFPFLHHLPELAQTHVHRLNYKLYQFLCALLLSSNSLGSYFVLFCCNASSCNSSRKDLCVVNFESLNNLNSIFFCSNT